MYAYAITEEGQEETDELRERIVASVEDAIGPFARPQEVVFAPDLPKTRSGKIMRRLLEDVANDDDLGDTSTLRNPEIVEEIQGQASAN
jgi:acetyl-CoA synthetase